VTAADLAAEALVRERLAATHPGDGIIGEEDDDVDGSTGRRWVVDPIDGTKAFTKGVPLYATLIALIDDHGPAVGVIHLPALGETIAAGRGLGCTFNGAPCRVSGHDTLDGAYATTSGFGYWPSAALQRVLDSDVVFRTWGDAYGYALVATGRAEAMIDPLANPWDIAPMACDHPRSGWTLLQLRRRRTARLVEPQQRRRHERPDPRRPHRTLHQRSGSQPLSFAQYLAELRSGPSLSCP
jgi:fructose-1,6-bisphosphatase/inositol monophosphatase family enzyme